MMKIEQIATSDIPNRKRIIVGKYDELFKMILGLDVGRGVCVTVENDEKPMCMASCIRDRLKTRGIVEKYIIAIRNKNNVYFGRVE